MIFRMSTGGGKRAGSAVPNVQEKALDQSRQLTTAHSNSDTMVKDTSGGSKRERAARRLAARQLAALFKKHEVKVCKGRSFKCTCGKGVRTASGLGKHIAYYERHSRINPPNFPMFRRLRLLPLKNRRKIAKARRQI